MFVVYQSINGNGTIVYQRPITDEQVQKIKNSGVTEIKVLKKLPSIRQLYKWTDDGVCPTPDGCLVEPDGSCEHGWESWLKALNLI